LRVLDNMVLRKILEPNRDDIIRDCVMRSIMICI
jgi:hypothetical protein